MNEITFTVHELDDFDKCPNNVTLVKQTCVASAKQGCFATHLTLGYYFRMNLVIS